MKIDRKPPPSFPRKFQQQSRPEPSTKAKIVFIVVFGLVIGLTVQCLEEVHKRFYPNEKTIAKTAVTKPSWYSVKLDHLPENLQKRFLQLEADNATVDFLRISTIQAGRLFREVVHTAIWTVCQPFMTRTSLNGFLGRSRMFIFSDQQFSRLLGKTDDIWEGNYLLDIGAGDGTITMVMAKHFSQVWTTEVSWPMLEALKKKGLGIADAVAWHKDYSKKFDVISCLNVLDRVSRPITMLENMRKMLTPGGKIIISLVLPLDQFVEFGDDNRPEELLRIDGKTFEEQATSFVTHVLAANGFQLEQFTKLPYLSEGGFRTAFYQLNAAVFVVSVR